MPSNSSQPNQLPWLEYSYGWNISSETHPRLCSCARCQFWMPILGFPDYADLLDRPEDNDEIE
jgi:hypothetical protein